jgi:antitoxin component YwqK of YwqJK toxin-antitoxin module
MKKLVFLFVFASIINISFSQTWVSQQPNGKYKRYDDKKLATEGEIQNGQRVGVWKYYFKGELYLETIFDFDQPVKDTYYEKGKPYKVVNYLAGKRQGEVITYSKSGAILKIENFKKDEYHGLITHNSQEGIKEKIANYNEGNKQWEKHYYASGNLKRELNFENDSLHGAAKFYFNNGQLMLEMNFEKGEIASVVSAFKRNGDANPLVTFNDGTGSIITYFDNEQTELKLNYLKGQLHGEQVLYSENGSIRIMENYKAGTPNGEVVQYLDNGELKMKGVVTNGFKIGKWTQRDYTGELEKERYTENDETKYSPYKYLKFYFDFGDVFFVVPNMPEYKGGMTALAEFLRTNVTYPVSDRKNDREGVSYVTFEIDERGDLINVRIFPGTEGKATASMHKEGLRVVALMPPWTPGTLEDNRPVKVRYSIPIRFKLR